MRPASSSVPRGCPDRDRLRAWLCGADVVAADGAVASWSNPRHPGFPYPEAAGIWLAWAAWRKARGDGAPDAVLAARVSARLGADLAAGRGVGKAGRTCLFDTCVALHGLVQAGAGGYAAPAPEAVRGALLAIGSFLERGVATDPPGNGPARWSERLGPFQRRAAGLLRRAARGAGGTEAETLASRLEAAVEEPPAGAPRYVHAFCYGLEGAAMAGEGAALRAGGDRLAALQRDDGGLPAWDDGSGPGRSDATAQAVRLWRLVPGRFDGPVRKALDFLAGLQAPEGGLRYETGCDDLPTWAACFADQAAAPGGPVPVIWT